ncbi:stress-inducible protein [Streptomyces sp. Ru71]|uniref:universal stress protein n=1 Tax=Streptomyces sp. Ru71 TaxID=2080746 RepID=UPI000CDDCCCF|nr:universal stress protein [Streptomyces sp. Ru71]POX55064.1 stress-inducible protein [Streptomyces sp. Ru71]
MVRTVVAGLDGSRESRGAAEWAAREAALRGLPLTIVHVAEPVPLPWAQAPLLGEETRARWSERISRETADGLRLRHPGVDLAVVRLAGRAADLLSAAAADAELIALGSRGMSGVAGYLVGSVGQAVIARTQVPVVLVRAGEQAADEHESDPVGIPSAATAFRPVVLGLDTAGPAEELIRFAFDEADRRRTALRVVHAWALPTYYLYGLSLDAGLHDKIARDKGAELAEALRAWRRKFPAVEVGEESRSGSAAALLIDAAHAASLVVVGRRVRRAPVGPHIGPVAHAVLHHAPAPVAVVAHD